MPRSSVLAPTLRAKAGLIAGLSGLAGVLPLPAVAHVKWFAPYIVDAPPAPLSATLENGWFWLAVAMVVTAFLVTRAVERRSAGQALLRLMDRLTVPLWLRMDDLVRALVAAFFVAIFAVGGVYLTPDLQTPSEWVSWLQLLIAAGLFWRRTMPFSALGIIGLWILALRDYEFFHLLDYLALGVAVAAYLVLAASERPAWRQHRFEVLRWGVAIALMWSSLEKFAYPDWFAPVVLERPFLTFGLPEAVFIPMAGVAEFTLGFGLVATPLVRRLSAVALLVIFNAAVYPFGRVDLIGHALVIAMLVVIAVDPMRELQFLGWVRRSFTGIPVGLAGAMAVFAVGYWGLHQTFYGADDTIGRPPTTTHTFSQEHPHGPSDAGGVTPDRTSLADPNLPGAPR